MIHTPQMNAVGTPSAPATLTDDYADNLFVTDMKFMSRYHLDFDYTPKNGQSNRYILVRIRFSNDGGTTWRSRTHKVNATTETKVYQDIALNFPGSLTSTGGTKYSGVFYEDGISSELIEIAVKEDSTGDHGTCYIGLTLADNPS